MKGKLITYSYFRYVRTLFAILILTALALPSRGQDAFMNFDIWQGQKTKIGSIAMDIYQDETGYVWLSTLNGVIRFDGHDFVHLPDLYPSFEAIPNYHISCVRIDEDGRIWIGTIMDGLYLIDRDGKLISFNSLLSDEEKLREFRIQDICFKDSMIFIKGRKGLNVYAKNGDSYSKIPNFTKGSDSEVSSVVRYQDQLWFATKTAVFSTANISSKENVQRPYLFIDKSDRLWLSSVDKSGTLLYQFEDGTWVLNSFQPLKKITDYRRYTWDYQDRLWGVKYMDNLVCYDFKKREWLLNGKSTNTNLDQRNIRDVCVDNSGTVWVGSNVVSLYKSRPDITSFVLPLSQNEDVKNCIQYGEQWMYSTGFGGLRFLNFDGKSSQLISKNSGLESNRMLSFKPYKNGKVGIHHSKGFQVMNEDMSLTDLVPFKGSNRSSCFHAGYYWVGGVNKIVRIHPENLDKKEFEFDRKYTDQRIYTNGLAPKSSSELYVGLSLTGVRVFDIEKETFTPQFSRTTDNSFLNNCNDLAVSSTFRLANAGQRGLYVFDDENKENLIPKKFINSVEWFSDSILMASTNHEIYKINLNSNQTSVLTQGDGLINSQFSLRSSFKTSYGVCFGGNRGLDCVSATAYHENLPTILFVESITTSDSEIFKVGESENDIELPMNTENVEIRMNHFYTKNYHEAKILYRNSQTEGWKPVNGNVLNLTNLRGGKHILEFKSSIPNYSGIVPHRELRFNIPIPWYKQFWVHLLIGLAVLIFCISAVSQYKNREKEKQLRSVQLKADIAELRLKALSSQMNPHFMFNALNSILQMIN